MGRQLDHEALVPAVGQAASKADPAKHSHLIRVVIPAADPSAPPVRLPPSSRTLARLREKAEAAAREAAAALALQARVQTGFQPRSGKVCDVDQAGLLLIGPLGAIGVSERAVRTLTPLSAGGRHHVSALAAAGGWQDEPALREFLAGLGGRLAAVGLRLDRRKAGWRMAKAQPSRPAP